MRAPLGIFEIFYGRVWTPSERLAMAEFLAKLGYQFYIYGPKMDACLRKDWTRPPTPMEHQTYREMQKTFRAHKFKFGMALSPQGLTGPLSVLQRQALLDKVKFLNDLEIDILGLFFDDMKSAPDMAEVQLDLVAAVQTVSSAKILFCPSYYSNDSFLDMLFGDRPPDYLSVVGKGLSPDVDIVWTGEQILSPEISNEHLEAVRQILKRKPFICDNFFANDGPINCNFLKLIPLAGRDSTILSSASAWGLNPMNQAALSKILLAATAQFFLRGRGAEKAFSESLRNTVPEAVAKWILQNRKACAEEGLSALSDQDKEDWVHQLGPFETPETKEIIAWLKGAYVIDLLAMLNEGGFETV